MKLTIEYYLSQNGQKASLKGGGDGHQKQHVEGDVTVEQFEADLEPRGWRLGADGSLVGPRTSNNWLELSTAENLDNAFTEADLLDKHSWKDLDKNIFAALRYDAPKDFGTLYQDYLRITDAQKAVIARIAAARKAQKAEEEAEAVRRAEEEAAAQSAAVSRFMANPDERGNVYRADVYLPTLGTSGASNYIYIKKPHPRYSEVLAEVERRNQADAGAKAAEEAARESAKQEQIEAWVREHGTEDQRERLDVGLLPREEAVAAMKDAAFAAGADLSLYERITKKQIDHNDDCRSQWDGDWDMDCETADAASVTAEEWAKLKAIKSLFPDAVECSIKRHTCKCDQCDEEVNRSGVYVKLQVGAFTFNREYSL